MDTNLMDDGPIRLQLDRLCVFILLVHYFFFFFLEGTWASRVDMGGVIMAGGDVHLRLNSREHIWSWRVGVWGEWEEKKTDFQVVRHGDSQ
jgi:hypothetical protein